MQDLNMPEMIRQYKAEIRRLRERQEELHAKAYAAPYGHRDMDTIRRYQDMKVMADQMEGVVRMMEDRSEVVENAADREAETIY